MHLKMKLLYCVAMIMFAHKLISGQRIPPHHLKNVPIVKSSYDANPEGTYVYSYETGNGIKAQQQGYVKNYGHPPIEAQVVEGSYSYTGPDNVQYTVTYIADENGFRAEGSHIPTPPPIPDAIQRALAYIATHPPKKQQKHHSKSSISPFL